MKTRWLWRSILAMLVVGVLAALVANWLLFPVIGWWTIAVSVLLGYLVGTFWPFSTFEFYW
jgi:hypothetical protein